MDKKETIAIEFQQPSGNWSRINTGIANNDQQIAHALKNAKRTRPNARIRAVGAESGRVYDMLN